MYMAHWREGTTEIGSQPGDRPFGPVVVQPDTGWRALAVVHCPHPVFASEDYVSPPAQVHQFVTPTWFLTRFSVPATSAKQTPLCFLKHVV